MHIFTYISLYKYYIYQLNGISTGTCTLEPAYNKQVVKCRFWFLAQKIVAIFLRNVVKKNVVFH